MLGRISSALLAATGFGMAVMSAGLASAPASASPAAGSPTIKTVIDTNFAGYVTTGKWMFRYVVATVPIAKCRKVSNQNAEARIALTSGAVNEAAHISLRCGGGPGSVRFGTVTHANGVLPLSPHVGDLLRISVYRNRATCRDTFSATNTQTHRTKTFTVGTPCKVVYRHAELGATLTDISGTWNPPFGDVQLWRPQDTAITSYNGIRGTICGPWPAEKHLAAPVITIRMIPSGVSDKCRDFSVLMKGRG